MHQVMSEECRKQGDYIYDIISNILSVKNFLYYCLKLAVDQSNELNQACDDTALLGVFFGVNDYLVRENS